MWRYSQSSGDLEHIIDDFIVATIVRAGYSGHGEGLNAPSAESVHNVGPIPRGRYWIGAPYDSPKVGPYALPLTPFEDNEMFGRSAFLIHGDRKTGPPRSASDGCIILPRAIREMIRESDLQTDNVLEVVA